MRRILMAGAIALLASSCSRNASPTDPGVPLIPASPDVRTAPETVAIGGATIRLSTSLWRDYMPPGPADGRPLAAILRVTDLKGGTLPKGLEASAAWVIVGSMAWYFVPAPANDASSATLLEFRGAEGPRWSPGTKADVVLELRDDSGAVWRVQAKRQEIVKTQ
ncbi:MAG TPA: hypothetical protein VMJ70_03055 [Candidatus Sulfotelmatobacter sp.]|nr:hypothetical protein [Candidatus Sulfotelmatobacter sp.]